MIKPILVAVIDRLPLWPKFKRSFAAFLFSLCFFLMPLLPEALFAKASTVNQYTPYDANGIMYVNQAVSGGDGSSWASPIQQLRDAITIAHSNSGVKQIWVAKGTYLPTSGTNRDTYFDIPSGTQVYGGFAGTETSVSARNIAANPTILSGDIGIPGNNTDNCYSVVIMHDNALPITLDGFTITGGYNNATGYIGYGDYLVIGGYGGGLDIFESSNPLTLNNLIITGNQAQYGGGIVLGYLLNPSQPFNLTANNCVISNNQSTFTAGGGGGGVVFLGNGGALFNNCVFDGNISSAPGNLGSGGGLQIESAQPTTHPVTATCNNCVFNNNQALGTQDDGGGALMNYGGTLNLVNCTLYNNITASTLFPNGNAISNRSYYPVVTNITNTIIWGSKAVNISNNQTIASLSINYTNSLVKGSGLSSPNLDTDPLFINQANAIGADGIWGSADDGLMVACQSPARGTGNSSLATATDILGTSRGSQPDMGAYQQTGVGVVPSVSIAVTSGAACPGTAITFSATPVNGGSPPTYQWQVNGVNAGTNSATFTVATLNVGDKVTCLMNPANSICVTVPQVSSNTIIINSLPQLAASGIATVNAAAAYTPLQLVATGGVSPYSFAVTSGSLPSGVTLSTGGILSGASDVPGSYQFTIKVTESGCSNTASQTYSTDVNGLTSLVSSTGTLSPVFDPGTVSYNLSLPNLVSSITLTPTAGNANAQITVNGTAVASGSASPAIALNVGSNTITTVVTAQDGITKLTYTVTVTRAPSTVATLSNLNSSQGTLTPVFSSGTTSYSDAVSNATTSLTVTPTVTDPAATITVNGTAVASGTASGAISLNVGANTITTVVTAQDGVTKQTYTVTVTRAPSSIATLNNLVISSGTLSPAFASGTTSYSDGVSNATTSVTVTPTVTDATATITVNGTTVVSGTASGAIALNVGANTITTVVTAQDGLTKQTYTVTVTRAPSSIATLNNLVISSGTLSPSFASGTASYSDAVSNATTSVTVTPTVTDPAAMITVNGTTVTSGSASPAIALSVGTNTITTEVTAQDGLTKQTYTVTVTRAPSSIATLNNLAISSGTLSPSFSSGTTSYSDAVSNATTSVTVTPTTTDATATITVNGTAVASGTASGAISLNVGANTITTVVTAQDGVTKLTYTVTVTRAPSSVATLNNLVISSGTLSPAFASGTTSYSDAVSNATTSVTVTPTVTDATATITVNGTAVVSGSASPAIALSVGPNTITTEVTAQDGLTKQTYSVTVTRAPSSLATLSNLAISSGTLSPLFASGTASYSDAVSNATTIVTVTPTITDATATITVNGTAVASGSASPAIALSVGTNTITTEVTAQDGLTKQTYTVTVTRAPSSVATLSNLAISSGTLSPAFASGTTSYSDAVSNATTSVTVTPTTTDATATITVNGTAVASGTASGTISLNVGANTITTVVTAQDGITKQTYTVTVTRAPSSVATLNNLVISSGTLSPAFASGTTSYSDGVSNATTSVTVMPTVTDATATITVNGTAVVSGSASPAIALSVGPNTITTVVTAQDGVTKLTYTVTVTRAPSSVATLNHLTISSGTLSPAFASGTTSYSDAVSNATTSVIVTPTVTDPAATITVNGTAVASGTASGAISLNVGANTITTVVTAQDGVTKLTYTVTVTRAPSSVATLSNLTISSGTLSPAFASGTTSYSDGVSNATTSVTVTSTVTDATATITVNGTTVASGTASGAIALNVGANTITIVVTAQDGTSLDTYTIVVTRSKGVQLLTFNPLNTIKYGTADFSPAASVNSGLPIIYSSSNPAVATIVNGEIHITGVGTTVITATANGNNDYDAASPVSQTLVVIKGDQTISVTTIPTLIKGTTYSLTGITASSGLPLSFSIANNAIATLQGQTLNAIGLGTTTLTVSQAGNSDYNAAVNEILVVKVVNAASGNIIVHQAVTPNGDGINDFLYIEGIESYPDNTVVLVNRNGVKIFQASGYDNQLHRFDGHSSINGDLQPAGTYFYLIDYVDHGEHVRKTGFFVLKY